MEKQGLSSFAELAKSYMEFARRVLRRWWLVAIFTLLGAGCSVFVALNMTRVYQSRTLVRFKEQVKQRDVLASSEGVGREQNWLDERLRETFSSTTLLWRVISELELFQGMRGVVAPEVVLDEMRERMMYGTVGSDSFWLSFDYKVPQKAQQVAARLADEFIKKNVTETLSAAQVTQSFMETEVQKVKEQLEQLDGDYATFVAQNPQYKVDPLTGLPRGMNVAISTSAAADAARYGHIESPELRAALARKGRLQAQLQLLQNPKSNPEVVQAQQELLRAKQAHESMLRKYTDAHPDTQRAARLLQMTQIKYRTAMQAHKGGGASVDQLVAEIAEIDATIGALTKQDAVKRRAQRAGTATPRKTPDANEGSKVDSKMAALEKRWHQLTRDQAIMKAKYDQLQERLLQTRVSAALEKKQAATQFEVVDAANLPGKPIRPNRTKMAIAGTFLGVMLGLGFAVLLVIFDPRVYNEDDLKKACDLPILAQIPKET